MENFTTISMPTMPKMPSNFSLLDPTNLKIPDNMQTGSSNKTVTTSSTSSNLDSPIKISSTSKTTNTNQEQNKDNLNTLDTSSKDLSTNSLNSKKSSLEESASSSVRQEISRTGSNESLFKANNPESSIISSFLYAGVIILILVMLGVIIFYASKSENKPGSTVTTKDIETASVLSTINDTSNNNTE